MNYIFRLCLTSSALFLFISIYLINQSIAMLPFVSDYVNYTIYIAIPFIFSGVSIFFSKWLGKGNMGEVKFVETSNNDFLSSYLAFFFVALSIDSWVTFFFCFGLILLFTFCSRVSYFNPVLLTFGYKFYFIHLANNSKVMLITKQTIKSPAEICEQKQYNRINDYTFIG